RRGQQTSVGINLDHDAALLGANPAWVPPAVALRSAINPCGLCFFGLNGILHTSWQIAHKAPNFNPSGHRAHACLLLPLGSFEGAEQVSSSLFGLRRAPKTSFEA
ncbi:unnamed protein product, partial [Symbiodinium sp. KB8]